ncbi:ketopantoate reductase family protein [Sulfitobacter sp. S0837]|uniref:ketopantoate reductase family protein n=1 Tax=Sulfitobacter maritimus TaxID=2741719 RepID=UPI001582254D|nr:2-dehydropantoate 2-reductase [Sulfitobacter maritimus]NUH63744.1 ketopantoate reductase family protein [Sulfitobacter maritimus]NUH63782.1 ketopantoate reductase family protein [Sulfitobacter maritimus]NUH65591.1 ketopantoate reductase family protein [Sulfitobacter maritimus]
MSDTPILIWGAGAIGGILGAYFARAGHAVHMVDVVDKHVEAMRTTGLRIEGPVEEFSQVLPASTPSELAGQYERIYLCVKAHHTTAALEMLVPHLAPGGYVVSAQNGLNEKVIAARIGAENTVGCFVNYGADWLEPGRILFGNRAAVAVGELDGSMTDRVAEVHTLLKLVEPDAVATDNIWGYLWGKMGYGSLLFCTALTPDSMSDAMARPEHRAAYRALGHEVMTLAAHEGVAPLGFNGFDPEAFLANDIAAIEVAMDRMVAHNRKTAKTHSGIWRDLAVRKRKTEVDAQIGVMVDLGRTAGISVPTLARMVDLIHDIEDGKREQSADLVNLLLPA